MKFKIYRPTKSAMQSGKKYLKKWFLVPVEEENIRFEDELMGWVSAKNTSSQIKFTFDSKEEAIKFAEKKKFDFTVDDPKISAPKVKSYAENFTKTPL